MSWNPAIEAHCPNAEDAWSFGSYVYNVIGKTCHEQSIQPANYPLRCRLFTDFNNFKIG